MRREQNTSRSVFYPAIVCILIVLSFSADSFADTAKTQHGCDIIKDGLVAWYQFGGDSQDKSGNQNHGVAEGNLTYIAGKMGKAAKFDGRLGYITVPHHDNLNLQNMTLSAWVYDYYHPPYGPLGTSLILCKGMWSFNDEQKRQFEFSSSYGFNIGFAHFGLFNSKTQQWEILYSEDTIPVNQWKYIAVTYDGHSQKIYIDGKLNNSRDAVISVFIPKNLAPLTIGAGFRDDNDQPLNAKNGLIDDLRIYNRALSDSEIKQLYDCATPNLPSAATTKKKPLSVKSITFLQGDSPPADTSPRKMDQSPNECVIDLNNNKHTCQGVSAITFISQPMNNQAVAKISFDPKLYTHNKAIFEVTYDKQPTGWTVDICDSKSCDGYGGDAGHTSNAAEVEILNTGFNAYRNTLHGHPDSTGESLRLFSKPVSISQGTTVSLEISNESLEWNFPNEKGKLESDRLFTLNGQTPTYGTVDYDIYVAFNRVITGRPDRNGSGAASVHIKLVMSKTKRDTIRDAMCDDIEPSSVTIEQNELDKLEKFVSENKASVLTIMCDDIEGSSATIEQIGDSAFRQLREKYYDKPFIEIITHKGYGEIIRRRGDGFIAVFIAPSIAVERALELQERFYKDGKIKVRIGLDMGQVYIKNMGVHMDLFRRHAIRAARAEAMSKGGHILVTRPVYENAYAWCKSHVSWKRHVFYNEEDKQPLELFEPYNANLIQPLEQHGKIEDGRGDPNTNPPPVPTSQNPTKADSPNTDPPPPDNHPPTTDSTPEAATSRNDQEGKNLPIARPQTIPSKYIFYFGLLMLILIALWILFLIFRYGYPVWKWGRLNEKGIRFFNQKEIDEAINCFESAIEIAKRVFGIKHPNYLMNLDKLAAGYYLIEKYDKAEELYDTALKIREEVFGKEHPDYVRSLNALSKLYMAMGEFRKAGPLANQSLKLIQGIFEETYPEHALTLENTVVLADIDLLNGNFKEGLEKLLKIARLHDYMIVRMYQYSNEKKVQEYIRSFKEDYFKIITAISKHYSELKSYMPEVFDAILRRKTIALEIAAIYRDHVISGENSKLRKMLKKLRISRRALAFLIMEGCRELCPKDYKQEVGTCEQKIESLEKELFVKIPEFELRKKLEYVDHKIIAEHLPEKTSLVEFVRYESYDFKERKSVTPCYVAFIMSSHDKDNIQMAEIGDASEIDELVRLHKEAIEEEWESRNIRNVIIVRQKKTMRLFIGKEIYKKLFKPVADCIGEAERLLISPDGDITLLPFEVLPMPDRRYVVEKFEISYIDSSRDLIRFQYHQPPQTCSVIMANPDFDLLRKSIFYYIAKILRMKRNIKRGLFNPLPGTMEEGTEIKKLLEKADMKFFFGEQVLDKRVKKLCSPYILHIATHGFFISGQDADDNRLSRILKQFVNPLLRSGLALAGANTFLDGKAAALYAEDGLLIASDVTGMDMMGTELVVLSACQTGLGEVRSGEGIYGLRRAFTIAGARTQLVSLWSVPDRETKELMISFYTKLSGGKGKAEALRESQREMIAKLRNEGKADYPFLWGAFICVGHPDRIKQISPPLIQE